MTSCDTTHLPNTEFQWYRTSPYRHHYIDQIVRQHLADNRIGTVTDELAAYVNAIRTGEDSDRLVALSFAQAVSVTRCRMNESNGRVNGVMTARLCVLGDGICLFAFYRELAGISGGTWSATILPDGIIETSFAGNFLACPETAAAIKTGLSELNDVSLSSIVGKLLIQPSEAKPLTPDNLAPFEFFLTGVLNS